MEKIIKELCDELLGKEMTLLEMDNTAIGIIGDTDSLFEYESYVLEQNCACYFYDDEHTINVEFKIIEENEEALDIIVEVENVWCM